MQLKQELLNVSIRSQTLSQYLTQIKTIVDNLAAADVCIDVEDIILYTLNGLPPSFQTFKTFIRNQLTPLSLDDFYTLICSEEINILKESKEATTVAISTEPSPTALYSQRDHGRSNYFRSRGRWNTNNNRREEHRTSNQGPHLSSVKSALNLDTLHPNAGIVSTFSIRLPLLPTPQLFKPRLMILNPIGCSTQVQSITSHQRATPFSSRKPIWETS